MMGALSVALSKRAEVVRQAAWNARTMLRGALESLQEEATAGETGGSSVRLLQLAEQVAGVATLLFELERSQDMAKDEGSIELASQRLSALLTALQSADLAGSAVQKMTEIVAQSQSMLFAAYRGSFSEEPFIAAGTPSEPPRSRRSLVLVDAADDSSPCEDGESQSPEVLLLKHNRNRRSTERVTLDVDVGFVSESNFYAGLAMDVSCGGLLVATYRILPIGTTVTVSFVLPDGQHVTASGEVKWTRKAIAEGPPGIGVAFKELREEDLKAIERFCKKRAPLYVDLVDD